MKKSIILSYLVIVLAHVTCYGQSLREDHEAQIVRQLNDANPDGSFNYAFETTNKIYAEAQGVQETPESLAIRGQYQYTSPEGELIRIAYIADENGFHPQGSHLPTPPPIPPLIQRALQYLAQNPANEQF